MLRALSEYVITGIKTTIPFHQRVMRSGAFLEGRLSTEFIERLLEPSGEEEEPSEVDEIAVLAAVLDVEGRKRSSASAAPSSSGGPSASASGGAWKLSARREALRGL